MHLSPSNSQGLTFNYLQNFRNPGNTRRKWEYDSSVKNAELPRRTEAAGLNHEQAGCREAAHGQSKDGSRHAP
jgi:hypothetical protein